LSGGVILGKVFLGVEILFGISQSDAVFALPKDVAVERRLGVDKDIPLLENVESRIGDDVAKRANLRFAPKAVRTLAIEEYVPHAFTP
jgi:hypothetical protein